MIMFSIKSGPKKCRFLTCSAPSWLVACVAAASSSTSPLINFTFFAQ